jgi:hypothetical protein
VTLDATRGRRAYDEMFDEMNEACQPLRLFINVTQANEATIAMVHQQNFFFWVDWIR